MVDQETLLGLGVRPSAARTGSLGPAQGHRTRATTTSTSRFPVGTVGEQLPTACGSARPSLRVGEDHRAALDGLPEGPHITTTARSRCRRDTVATSMEALIHHFKLVTEGFRVPRAEAYYPIEGPARELGCFVRADVGQARPACTWPRPGSSTCGALTLHGPGRHIADLIATLAMLTPSWEASTGEPAVPVPRFGMVRAFPAGTRPLI